MKQFLLITMLVIGFIGSTGSSYAAMCAPGNFEFGDYCCVAIGNGNATSCTDGECWFCTGDCAADDATFCP